MAIKDWKKIVDNKFETQWDKHYDSVRIVSYDKVWDIYAFKDSKTINLGRRIRTKSQAIAYAKEYMRTH